MNYYNDNCNLDSFLGAKFITEKAQDVCINEKGIKKLTSEVRFLLISLPKTLKHFAYVHGLW